MTKDNISKLEGLPLDVWQELKRNSEVMIRNSKISFYQGTTLLSLALGKISELKKKDDDEDVDIKEVITEVLDAVK